MHVSVVATVWNEEANVERLLNSLAAQTRRPDEVILCDGGSSDDTVARIEAFARGQAETDGGLVIQVLVESGANISQGRNAAIRTAAGPIIAVTDAGVRLAPTWLEYLIAPFDTGEGALDAGEMAQERIQEAPVAVAGFFLPDTTNVFTTAMAATVLPSVGDIDPAHFLPSSRSVAFTKAAWSAAGGYPEWLDYCEDLVFDFRINGLSTGRPGPGGSRFVWAPQALVYFRPRESLGAFWRQYYRYARGDGKADLWRKRHAVRYIVYLVILPALIGHSLWGAFARELGWLGLGLSVLLYCRRPWRRLFALGSGLTLVQMVQAMLWIPVVRAVGDLAKMAGYPVGWIWRWRHWHRPEIHWQQEGAMGREFADRRP